jgi:hypothetical protein
MHDPATFSAPQIFDPDRFALLRDYTWELPTADHPLTCGELVPLPKDGLPARLTRHAD